LKLLVSENELSDGLEVFWGRQVFVERIDHNGPLNLNGLAHVSRIKEQTTTEAPVWRPRCPLNDCLRPECDDGADRFVRCFLPGDIPPQVEFGTADDRDEKHTDHRGMTKAMHPERLGWIWGNNVYRMAHGDSPHGHAGSLPFVEFFLRLLTVLQISRVMVLARAVGCSGRH
jgi:hypothetical protein